MHDPSRSSPSSPLPAAWPDGLAKGVRCEEAGFVLGAATSLVRRTDAGNFALGMDSARYLALLSVLCRRPVGPDTLRPIECAAFHWEAGDKALANLRLVFSGLPKLDAPADAARLQAAAYCLDQGMAPRDLMTALDLDPSVLDLVKFDPDQPRVPAGNGRDSGRWRTFLDGIEDWLDQPVPEYDTDTGLQVGTQSRGHAIATNPATVGIAGTAALLGGEAAVGALVTDGVPIGTVLPDGTVAGANAAGAAPNLARLGAKFGINAESEAGANILRNLNISVRQFISQYRSGSILREFPGEHLEGTVGEALQSGGSRVRKLLMDSRFAK